MRIVTVRRVALGALLTSFAFGAAACGQGPSNDIVVPASDPTPPTAGALQADIPNRPLATVSLGSATVSAEMGENDTVRVVARGDDNDGGVQDVRIWASTTLYRSRAGVVVGPSLAGAPMASNPSSAVPGQTASKSGSATWTFSVPALMTGYDGLKLDVYGEVVNFSGGSVRTSTLTLRFQRKDLELHVVALTDTNGGHAFSATPAAFASLLGRVNTVYSGTGIRFLFDPSTDWETKADTQLNQEQSGFQQKAAQIAAAHPDKIVLFLRWGSNPASRTGNGNAFPPPGVNPTPLNVTDATQDYVMLPDLLDTTLSFLNLDNGSFMAHELGHYLGLYHTFPGWSDVGGPIFNGTTPPSQAAADQTVVSYIAANGGTIDALDGDALSDTPPDPGPVLYGVHGQNICTNGSIVVSGTLNGQQVTYTFTPDRTNVMGYYTSQQCTSGATPPPQTFTFQQIQRMQHTLTQPPRKQLWP